MTIDAKKILADVRANLALLDACQRHQFTHPAPFTPGGRSVCSACGGKMDPLQAKAYDLGLKHATLAAAAVVAELRQRARDVLDAPGPESAGAYVERCDGRNEAFAESANLVAEKLGVKS